MIVIADDSELEWPKRVLANVQQFIIGSGFFCREDDASIAPVSSR